MEEKVPNKIMKFLKDSFILGCMIFALYHYNNETIELSCKNMSVTITNSTKWGLSKEIEIYHYNNEVKGWFKTLENGKEIRLEDKIASKIKL